MADRLVGLSFDGGEIRAVEVSPVRGGRYRCTRAGSIGVPEDSMRNGAIVDEKQLAAAIAELWQQSGFSTSRVRVSIDGRLAVLRRTEIPTGRDVDLREAAAYDIADLLSYSIDEAVYDVAVIDEFERDGRSWVKALVVSVSDDVIQAYRSLLAAAGLTMVEAAFMGDAITAGLDASAALAGDAEDVASLIVDIEDTVTSVFVHDSGGVRFARTIDAGVGASALSLAEELESELAFLSGDESPGGEVASQPSGVETVVEGVRRTMAYFDEIDEQTLSTIVLTGSRSHAPSLSSGLEHALGLAVQRSAPIVSWPEGGPDYSGFEVALGAALLGRVAYRSDRRLELRSEADRLTHSRTRQRVIAAVLTALVAVLAGLDGYNRRAEAALESEAARAEEHVSDLVNDQLLTLDDAMFERDSLLVGEDLVRQLTDQRVRFLDVLQETAEVMPTNSQLVSVQLRRGDPETQLANSISGDQAGVVTFTGIAADLDVVGRWLDDVEEGRFVDGLWLDQSIKGEVGESGSEASFFVVEGLITPSALWADRGES